MGSSLDGFLCGDTIGKWGKAGSRDWMEKVGHCGHAFLADSSSGPLLYSFTSLLLT